VLRRRRVSIFDFSHSHERTPNTETVISVHHWNDTLLSFRATRAPSLRLINGQFGMVGIEVDGKPMASAAHRSTRLLTAP
jgi:ferredoxin-NADP reductase